MLTKKNECKKSIENIDEVDSSKEILSGVLAQMSSSSLNPVSKLLCSSPIALILLKSMTSRLELSSTKHLRRGVLIIITRTIDNLRRGEISGINVFLQLLDTSYVRATRELEKKGETYIQFAARLTANFQYYCSLRKVNSFESLCDLIISDELFETLNKETATHIGIREAEDWFRPIDLAKECDIYISSRSGSHKETPITYGYTQDPFKNRSRNFKPEIKENYPQNLERENKNCFIYAVIHLITQETVRSVLNLKNLTTTSIIE
ncbi:uncharacterized protein TNCV_26111 [Trichonephila clavipes]|uniref:Uncharacterized protein n=1 Tax=Trichonephila clavipes TaxID=2585209 RepID=A0A8X6W1R4_TRICX|nr:uncharacterized protein TNCV_26111 [Trichonephila clavipes]